jgi:hypothetical protein
VTTPDDPTALEPPEDEVPQPAPAGRRRSLGLASVERYLPSIAVGGMIAIYLQIENAFLALTIIAVVWLLATRIASSRRFLGLTLTEALAWDATVLILLGLVFNILVAAQQPA